jgi:phosphoesterase RecJ-like protein
MSDSTAVIYQQVIDRLKAAERVLAVTHINPDGDALGSLGFFGELLASFGKVATLYCAGPLPKSLEFLPGFSNIITDKNSLSMADFDLIVSLDCGSVSRTNLAKEIANRSKQQFFIEIDHHPSLEGASDLELRLTEAASTTEILFRLAAAADLKVSPTMAQALLTGIITDTANFIHPTATPDTLAAASSILSQGANLSRLSDQTMRTKTLGSLKLWGIALSRLQLNPRYNLAFTVLNEDDLKNSGADYDSIQGIAGFISSIKEAAVSLILRNENGMVWGSLRTSRDDIDLNRLARALGGGGHRRASGFNLPGRLVCENGHWSVEYK